VRRRGRRLAVLGALAAITVGCGVFVLETEDPDPAGLDESQELEEPLPPPPDEDVGEDTDDAEGTD
jgi:hypothetical protein